MPIEREILYMLDPDGLLTTVYVPVMKLLIHVTWRISGCNYIIIIVHHCSSLCLTSHMFSIRFLQLEEHCNYS